MNDNVNHPKHYNSGKIEVIEAIEDWDLGFHLGNAVKYIARAGKKDPSKLHEDLEKAIWYLRRKLELTRDSPRRPNQMPQERRKSHNPDCWTDVLDGKPVYKCTPGCEAA